jgi:hypothetical protein
MEASLTFAFWLYKTMDSNNIAHNSYMYFKTLDTLLIVRGPNQKLNDILQMSDVLVFDESKAFSNLVFNSNIFVKITSKYSDILKLEFPSLAEFSSRMNRPILLTGLIENWAALQKWKIPSFWSLIAGHRFFPVEIGESYLSTKWSQDIIQLNQYLQKYVFDEANTEIAYIAQHNWIHQVPSLLNDFEIPEICDIFLSDYTDSVLTHLWFGMKQTLSPLHFDKYNNVFSQVVGSKYLIIVDPIYSPKLSDGKENSSNVDPRKLVQFLKENNISFTECILNPGDSIFIPSKWWHQIESLSFSVSVSFWF